MSVWTWAYYIYNIICWFKCKFTQYGLVSCHWKENHILCLALSQQMALEKFKIYQSSGQKELIHTSIKIPYIFLILLV